MAMAMTLIAQVVKESLITGYLTEKAEQRIQRLFERTCDLEDIDALEQLQQALTIGQVKRQTEQSKRVEADRASLG
jgi:hypothetical protein